MTGALVAGVDSSTQATKVVVRDAVTGRVVREGRAGHPDVLEADPASWWDALQQAAAGLLEGVTAISVAAQQHGCVLLDEAGDVVRPALLWNDLRSARATEDLLRELGGAAAWVEATGSVPSASFTVTKLRWLAEQEPESVARAARVLLPHDWLTWRLRGGRDAGTSPTTDRGDASGTGYFDPAKDVWRTDLLRLALGSDLELPDLVAGDAAAGTTPNGLLVAAGTGDNMGAALGLDLTPGTAVVSLGTSGTAFAVSPHAVHDPSGDVAGFADARRDFLPLVCTLNAARVLATTATTLGVDVEGLDRLALSAAPGAGGVLMVPYLEGERTPRRPDAAASLHGLTRDSMRPENLARAAVEGMLCGMADALDALRAQAGDIDRVLLIGGAAQSQAVRSVAPALLGAHVVVPEPAEYVALGAARQAAEALAAGGSASDVHPETWSGPTSTSLPDPDGNQLAAAAETRARYAEVTSRLFP